MNNINNNRNNIENSSINIKKQKKIIDFSKTVQMAFKFMYIGEKYDGLVIQTHTKNTIEEQLFSAFKKASFLENKPTEELLTSTNYSRCGRTDKGVSSTGNIFSLNVRYNENYNYTKILNNILPDDINILNHIIVDDSFDARFSCLYREYKYFFIKENLNIDLMKKACELLKGVHNFKKFCKIDKSDENWKNKNYERRIYEIDIKKENDININFLNNNNINNINNENDYYTCYYCIIKGSAFLWHQVRCIMSILFLIGNEQEEISIIKEMLNIPLNDNKEFFYSLADEKNLILTDCVFEFYNFQTEDENNSSDCYFKLEKLYKNNLKK
jgi:tRNA pseudouridine38/39 synthase